MGELGKEFGILGGRPKKGKTPLAKKKATPRSKQTNRKYKQSKSTERAARQQNMSGETLRKFQYVEKSGDQKLADDMKKVG